MVRGARYVTLEVWSAVVSYCLEIHFGGAAGGSIFLLLFESRSLFFFRVEGLRFYLATIIRR